MKVEGLLNNLDNLHIKRKNHPTLPISILDYDQYESPKFNESVDLCRGLVVDIQNKKIVAKPFTRFYNVGENNLQPAFPCSALDKLDGSLCIVYWYAGEWRINSRYSFGDFLFDGAPLTFKDSVLKLLGSDLSILHKEFTYIFEYVGPYNQVVIHYPKEELYLLGVIQTDTFAEVPYHHVANIADMLSVKVPQKHFFKDADQLNDFILNCQYEGLVIQPDDTNVRMKLKTKTYLQMHHLRSGLSNTLNCFLELWIAGEVESTLFLLPQYKDKFNVYQEKLNGLLGDVHATYDSIKDITLQKDFAREALKYPYSGLLFNLRKGIPITENTNLVNVLGRLLE